MRQTRFLFTFIFALIALFARAQNNRKLEREYNRKISEISKDTFGIIPFPGEHPTDIETPRQKRDGTLAVETNWGADALKLSQLRARMVAECKNRVHVRIVDTAGDTDHGQLDKGKQPGAIFTGEPAKVDVNGHGTHCTGIMFARDFGICYPLAAAGVLTWEMDKILGDDGSGSFDWFATCESLQADKDKARKSQGIRTVVSGSFGGGTGKVTVVENALKKSVTNGTVYVIAAGNTGATGVGYPGNSMYCIATASLDSDLKRSSYSTMGPEVLAAMPGRNIKSTWPGNTFSTISGTSMATPFLAGCTAIAISKWGDKLPDYLAVKKYLAAVAQDLPPTGKDNQTGYGIEFIEKILNTEPGSVVLPPPPPDTTAPPVRPERSLSFAFTGKLPMYWSIAGAASKNGIPKPCKVSEKMAAKGAFELLTVTRIEISLTSATDAKTEYKRLKSEIETFIFKDRGLMLEGGSDYADAAKWAAYFTEVLLSKQAQVKVIAPRVTRIEATDKDGNPVLLIDNQLTHFK